MSIHAENHADAAEACQLNGVRAKTGAGGDTVIVHAVPQPLRSQGILNDIVPEPSSCAFAEEKIVSATAFPATETAGRSASEFSQDILESCSLTSASSASSHSAFRPVVWAVFAIILAIIISIARRWPRKFSIESSPLCCGKQRMDDGGRRGNAPPNATYGKVAEKQSGVAA